MKYAVAKRTLDSAMGLLEEIIEPTVYYNADPVAMARMVIEQNQVKAREIRGLFADIYEENEDG